MNEPNRFPILLLVAVVVFVVVHLALEYITGGVRSHNMLNRPDLPAISNWLGLITLPALAIILGLRVRTYPSSALLLGVPHRVLAALLGALLYGAGMATSFWLGAENVTFAALVGIFVCALVFPVYRVEYILGFVVGMTTTFGGVLPLAVALVVALVSFAGRYLIGKAAIFLRMRNRSEVV